MFPSANVKTTNEKTAALRVAATVIKNQAESVRRNALQDTLTVQLVVQFMGAVVTRCEEIKLLLAEKGVAERIDEEFADTDISTGIKDDLYAAIEAAVGYCSAFLQKSQDGTVRSGTKLDEKNKPSEQTYPAVATIDLRAHMDAIIALIA